MADRKGLQSLGDFLPKLVEKYKPPPRAQRKLIEAAAIIREEPDAAERAFMARQLVQCTLPHTNPGNVERWSRRSGNLTLGITPGQDFEKNRSLGYPYGSIPRLLLFWMTTEVQHTKNRPDLTLLEKRTLHLGRNLADFMRAVGLNPDTGGGKRGDAKRLHDQMRRLLNARISFQQTIDEPERHGERRLNMEIAPRSELWWSPKHVQQGALWESWIQLSEDFYNAILASPVPVDMRALRALKRSPLALDLYAWTAWRAFTIVQKKQPPKFTPWQTLMRQLGTDYADVKDFKKYAGAALRKVASVYPGLTIGKARGGFTIHAPRLAVPRKIST